MTDDEPRWHVVVWTHAQAVPIHLSVFNQNRLWLANGIYLAAAPAEPADASARVGFHQALTETYRAMLKQIGLGQMARGTSAVLAETLTAFVRANRRRTAPGEHLPPAEPKLVQAFQIRLEDTRKRPELFQKPHPFFAGKFPVEGKKRVHSRGLGPTRDDVIGKIGFASPVQAERLRDQVRFFNEHASRRR